jgi:hypothetical protein
MALGSLQVDGRNDLIPGALLVQLMVLDDLSFLKFTFEKMMT